MVGRIAQEPFDTTSSQRAGLQGLLLAPDVETELAAITPRYNLAPTQLATILYRPGAAVQAGRLIWRLIPPTERRADFKYTTINAQIETMHRRPSYRGAVRARRCVVPVTGYYEWTGPKADKQPHFLRHDAGDVLWAAGLWEPRHQMQADGEPGTFAIITRPAVGPAASVHARMPAFVPAASLAEWIDGDAPSARSLLESAEAPPLHVYPVSRRVNGSRHDDPTLIEPIELQVATP